MECKIKIGSSIKFRRGRIHWLIKNWYKMSNQMGVIVSQDFRLKGLNAKIRMALHLDIDDSDVPVTVFKITVEHFKSFLVPSICAYIFNEEDESLLLSPVGEPRQRDNLHCFEYMMPDNIEDYTWKDALKIICEFSYCEHNNKIEEICIEECENPIKPDKSVSSDLENGNSEDGSSDKQHNCVDLFQKTTL